LIQDLFSTRLDEIEFESLNNNENDKNDKNENIDLSEKKDFSFEKVLKDYLNSDNYGNSLHIHTRRS
jgi:two-component system sensor histidine kinase ChvG